MVGCDGSLTHGVSASVFPYGTAMSITGCRGCMPSTSSRRPVNSSDRLPHRLSSRHSSIRGSAPPGGQLPERVELLREAAVLLLRLEVGAQRVRVRARVDDRVVEARALG